MTSTTVANMMTTAATATTKQPIIIEKLLPDELITHILMYLHSDLKTLCTMAEISLRLRRVAMQVIRLYFLPNIRLSTFIDQEGRRKSTMQYVFDSLDDTTLEIQFKPMSISPQRYRNDNYAASPTLHRLSMSDANNYSASALSWPLYTFTTTDPNEEGENTTSDDDKNNSRRQPSWHTLDSITSNTLPSSPTNMSEFMNNKMIETTTGKRKQLQITKPGIFSSSTSSNGNSGSSLWQLEYRVSTDHHSASMSAVTVFDNQNVNEGGNERFVTPLYVKTHLSMFSKAQSSGKIYKRLSLNGKENNSNSKSILQWFKKRS
ncbi:hypothetical protein BDA99DRAFT_502617 [Phascolomyces articulosus]|uniref:F-box domain-containing protein n=1 Tax=Phascolomyces articulosus TaxID=60185 RepID=A0AAD5KHJ5_9FUNG|nr:hypothetical protein BDA99DRAFT_502617 [Phascolomyces articulosus]